MNRMLCTGAVALAVCSAVACGKSDPSSALAEPGLPKVWVSQVSSDPGNPSGEAWVVTHPDNPDRVLVIWLVTKDPAAAANLLTSRGYCGVAVSNDGGRSWSDATAPLNNGDADAPICGDPVAGIGPDGTVYIGAVQLVAPAWMAGRASSDFGASWEEPTEIFGLEQMLAAGVANPAHPTPAIAAGRSYMAVDSITGEVSVHSQEDGGVEGRWLTVSSDRGATWSVPRPLDPQIQSNTAGPHSAAGGVIAVVYNVDPASPTYLASPDPAVSCEGAPCTVFQTTTDQGLNWERHVMPATAPSAGWGKIVAADPSQPGRFAVLFNYGNSLEIWLTRDSGESWAKAWTLNAPDDAAFAKPWIAYAPNGTLGAVWRVAHADGTTQPAAMVSRNGGSAFSHVIPLTAQPTAADASFTPGDDCACNLHLDDTRLSTTWSDRQSGQRQIYFGRFDYTGLPQGP